MGLHWGSIDFLVKFTYCMLRMKDKEEWQEEWHRFMEEAKASGNQDRWLEYVGIPIRILIYAALITFCYVKIPDIANRQIGSLTIYELTGAVVGLGMMLGLGYYLFHPSDDPDDRKGWGGLGLIALAGIAIFLWYQWR